jgi:multiple sugar transport system permease protein
MVLKVFELPDPRKTDAYAISNVAVIEAFKKKYPDIELRSFSGIKIEGMDLDSGPLMAIAGGVASDIMYVNFRQSDTYIQNNFLYPLDEFMAKENPEMFDLRVEKPVWQVIKRKKKGDEEEKVGRFREFKVKTLWPVFPVGWSFLNPLLLCGERIKLI